MNNPYHYEVIIIGGSYAGLSAAMALGRSRRQVLVIDSGKPCNSTTPHAHNFLTEDGVAPAAIISKAKQQVLSYPTIAWIEGKAIKTTRQDEGFEVVIEGNEEKFHGKKLLLATGITDIMPEIPGFSDCWGVSVLHCPYCHGYEVREKKTGIIANGDTGFEMAKTISQWTDTLTLFTNGPSLLRPEQQMKMLQHHIKIADTQIERLEHHQGYVKNLLLTDGSRWPLEVLYARPGFRQHSDLARQLGCQYTEAGYIETDVLGKTSIAGVFAAGDNMTPIRSLAVANAAGQKAGAGINKELIDESF